MKSLATKYLGIDLKNPLVISSSGLTSSVAKIVKLEESGAGAVVLKSLFEEQIRMEAGTMISSSDYPEAQDYIMNYTRSNTVDQYLQLIEDAKKSVTIPVIASINCISASEWQSFAKSIQQAGADAIELNAFVLPDSVTTSGQHYEQLYYDILAGVKSYATIPVSVKLGQNFSNIPALVNNLYARGARGVVLFNRFPILTSIQWDLPLRKSSVHPLIYVSRCVG